MAVQVTVVCVQVSLSLALSRTHTILFCACACVQVAERALFLWNNEYIVSLIAKSRDVILPVLYPALEANTTKHWNRCSPSTRASA